MSATYLTPAEMLSILSRDGRTLANALAWDERQTGDYDGPSEPCTAQRDLDTIADEECSRYQRWLEGDL